MPEFDRVDSLAQSLFDVSLAFFGLFLAFDNDLSGLFDEVFGVVALEFGSVEFGRVGGVPFVDGEGVGSLYYVGHDDG